jgi:hypothetical protein
MASIQKINKFHIGTGERTNGGIVLENNLAILYKVKCTFIMQSINLAPRHLFTQEK